MIVTKNNYENEVMKSDKKPSLKEVDALATKYAKKQIALFEDYEALAEKLHNELEAKIAKWPESAKNMVLELQSSKFDKMMDQKNERKPGMYGRAEFTLF